MSSVTVSFANEPQAVAMIPAWLQTHLEITGAWNGDGVSRRAQASHCRRCGRVVLRGLDADRAALVVIVDPEPLNALGEFLALSAGRMTFDLTWRLRYELDPRDAWRIRARPAAVRGKSVVVVQHSCVDVMPFEGRIIVEQGLESDRCPF